MNKMNILLVCGEANNHIPQQLAMHVLHLQSVLSMHRDPFDIHGL